MSDRRKHYRTGCRITACLEQHGMLKAEKRCQTSNIGMKGIFIQNLPKLPIGSSSVILIHDRNPNPLRLTGKVTHVSYDGVGFSFSQPQLEDCLRLKHLVKPHWDRKDFLQGLILMMRYSKPSTELKDALMLTRLLETESSLFARKPHEASQCHFVH